MKRPPARLSRRHVFGATAAALAVAAVIRRTTAPASGPHSPYFQALNHAVRTLGVPALVIDRRRLRANARSIVERVRAAGLSLRLVVKSLPSLPLLDALEADTKRYMAFHPASVAALWARDPQADILLGKPMPIEAVKALHRGGVWGEHAQWLIDSEARLTQYEAFAQEQDLRLKVSLEIDVGLHRGGFDEVADVARRLRGHPRLQLSGLMGYDAHVAKTPSPLRGRAFLEAQRRYRAAIAAVAGAGFSLEGMTLNSGGSATFALHLNGTAANEVAVGSAFVAPSDFAQQPLEPAAFIATPVLKRLTPSQIPGLEVLSAPRQWLMPETGTGLFVFGGNWMARPVSPPGLGFSDLFGRSSNQELLLARRELEVAVGDCVFYWPTQAEGVLDAFSELIVVEDGEVVDRYPVLR